jgi:hypothetical protein
MQLKSMVAVLTVCGLAWSGGPARAQDSPAATPMQPAAVSVSAPPMSYGMSQVLQLVQAKVGEDTIIAFIQSSRNSYGLTADQIIYLKQQGVSDAVITAMLKQPRAGVAEAGPTAPLDAEPAYAGQDSTATVAPPDASGPETTYYAQPYYYDQPYYCPGLPFYYGGYWGGGYGGGYRAGGFRGGTGFHGSGGGGFHGRSSTGFHGSGGGGSNFHGGGGGHGGSHR